MKKLIPIAIFLAFVVGVMGITLGASPKVGLALPYFSQTQGLIPGVTNTYYIGTSSPSTLEYKGLFVKDITVSGTCTGCGSGSWATTSTDYWFTQQSYELPLTFNYPLSRSVNAISMVATSSLNLTVGTFLSPNISQWTNDSGYQTYTWPFPSNATSSLLSFTGGLISNASSTLEYFNSASSSIDTLAIPSLTSALLLTNGNGVLAEYAGASACTAGQAVTAISALGATTCTAVSSFAYPFTPTAIGNSTSTLMQFSGGLIATASSTMQYLNTASTSISTVLNIPYGSAPTVAVNGDIGIDSTSNQFKYQSGSATQVIPAYQKAFAGFSTSTTWTGTTTVQGTPAFEAQTFVSALCYTDAGTVGVSLYDGQGNRADYFVASTATTSKTYTTNNTFYAGEKRYMDFGTPATSPTNITCVFKTTITAD